ncbi:hypothetical protein FIBSPDRAFT_343572 [Athelia psychrophila]|uniref:Phosphatase 2A Regulatory Subunit A helical domain-containing protein n=1 Tax=Athelia psychrophila TaxID=1759441 RepID=A0A167W5M6_9AGAM|nr:hypothetical protein FIBSPDRAFT_343572 [Fibularhizoctonia sp. CBS 109695]
MHRFRATLRRGSSVSGGNMIVSRRTLFRKPISRACERLRVGVSKSTMENGGDVAGKPMVDILPVEQRSQMLTPELKALRFECIPSTVGSLMMRIMRCTMTLAWQTCKLVSRAAFRASRGPVQRANITSLCIFLGRQQTSNVLRSHMITYLNERDYLAPAVCILREHC